MNFDNFLEQIDRSDVDPGNWPDLPEDPEITGSNVAEEDESKSVSRFKSLENSPPSLSSLCIFKISSWINEMTCDPLNNKTVQDMFHNQIEALPRELKFKIHTQLSMTSLRCIYQHRVWELDPHIIAAGIKQEEDMLRYLFWKQPNNPLLKHFEKTLVTRLFEDKKSIDLINTAKLTPTANVKESLVQGYLKDCLACNFVSKQEFLKNFEEMTNGCLKKLDWNNVLVVGGSVLKSVKQQTESPNTANRYNASDIDMYLYGLTKEAAQAKVLQIYKSIQSCWQEKIGIFKTANTITLVSNSEFRNIQIILSTYASPLEILLASDMNSCSIGFNGDTVLVIPRFLFGSIYGSNFLDSSTKFGTKLRWERIAKYYKRGYNVVAPLYLRVHGYGSFNTVEKISKQVHPTTNQMIELMCLMKMVLMRMSYNKDNFGISRETAFDNWPTRWVRGVYIVARSCTDNGYEDDDYKNLCKVLPNPPEWVTRYYQKRQILKRPVIREAPRYSEESRTIDQMKWSKSEQNFDPSETSDIDKYVRNHCKFDNYNESALQCFHLNLFVNKEQTAVNPYREMNTSLVTMDYRTETLQLTFTNFKSFLNGAEKNITHQFKMHNYNWKLKLKRASNSVSFIMLTKEPDEEDNDSFNNTRYRPTKFFANFLIRIKNQKKVNSKWHTIGDIIYDGSHVFTYNRPDNMWLIWVHNKYFNGTLNDAGESAIQMMRDYENIDGRPSYIEHGNVHWEIVMQLIEPHFNITAICKDTQNLRDLIKSTLTCLALLTIIALCFSQIYAVDFDVADYNAFPDDGKDDTSGFYGAINDARAMNGTFARVVLHPGTYVVNNRMNIAQPCINLVIEGNGATVVFNVTTIGFYLTDCSNVTLQNLFIDYDPLPFTGGKVLSINSVDKSFDLEVAAPHTADTRPMDGYITYDLDRRRFGVTNAANTSIRNVDVYQTDSTTPSMIVSQNPLTVRFFALGNVPSYLPGQNLVVRYQIYVYNCIDTTRSDRITVLNTTVWTCPGMGFVATHSSNIRLDRFNVMKKGDRWMSSAADGTHLNNVRGTVEISNGYYEGMGDDAINIHNSIMAVWDNNGTSVALSRGRDQPGKPDLLQVGDVIGFASPDDPFHPYVHATITSVYSPAGNFTYCTFDVDVSMVAANDVAVLETIATAHIYNVTVARNRARGFLINNRQSLVEDCTFDQISGPALLMDCEAYYWWEGNCARNLVVRNSRFIDCNYGTAQREGLIVMSSARSDKVPQAAGVFHNITFTDNSFEGPVARSYFLVGSASDVTIKNNMFDNSLLLPIETVAVICSSSDVLLSCNELAVDLLANQTMYPQGLKNLTTCISPSSNINVEEAFIGICLPPVTPVSDSGTGETPTTQVIPTSISDAHSISAFSINLFFLVASVLVFY